VRSTTPAAPPWRASARHRQHRRAASVFCSVREPVPLALCGFYAAAFHRLLALFDIGARTEVVACRGTAEHRASQGRPGQRQP